MTADTPTPHRATEDEWRGIEYMRQPIEVAPGFMTGGKEQSIASCILELRDTLSITREALAALERRVGALETQALGDVTFTPEEAEMIAAPWSYVTPPAAPPGTRLHGYSIGEAKPIEDWGKNHTLVTPVPDRPTQPPAVSDALLAQWMREAGGLEGTTYVRFILGAAIPWAWAQREEEVREAEQRGADAELDACINVLQSLHLPDGYITQLRAARRPSPPTLREQALADVLYLESMEDALLEIHGDSLRERLARITAALQEGANG